MSHPLSAEAGDTPPAAEPQADQRRETRAGTLPAPLDALIGRQSEIELIQRLLARDDIRLITLNGSGGVGKTRLALATGVAAAAAEAHDVIFVPLGSVQDPALVSSVIAKHLDVPESNNRSIVADVIARLRDQRLLLILDNFEHLLDAAPLVSDLLLACPRLKVMATSRHRLGLSGEHKVPVAPLALADPARHYAVEELAGVAAIQLFVARAQAAVPSFVLTEANGPRVAEICQRLDGLPLAIELAAPRIRLLSPVALLGRLTNRLDLLADWPRDAPARLQTMRQAIEWSYDLLDTSAQALLRHLAIFVGGFSLHALDAVGGASSSATTPDRLNGDLGETVFAGLGALVGSSLVRAEEQPDDERRFSMLATVREYALERLEGAGEAAEARRRHAAYCLSLVDAEDPGQNLPGEMLDRLQAEHDNLRAALRWTLDDDPESALRLAGGLWRFWSQRGYWNEGRTWLEQAIAGGSFAPADVRAAALGGVGQIAIDQGDFMEGRRRLEESLALARQAGDERWAARTLRTLGVIASNQSEFARAVELFDEALVQFRAMPEPAGIGRCLNDLALVADRLGHVSQAIAYYEEALGLARLTDDRTFASLILSNLGGAYINSGELARGQALTEEALLQSRRLGDDLGEAINLYNLGDCVRQRGEVVSARDRYRESLTITAQLDEQQLSSRILDRIAELLVTSGLPRFAAHLLGAAAAARRAIGDELFPSEEAFVVETTETTRTALGDEAFAAAWDAGASLSLDEAIAEALAMDLPGEIVAQTAETAAIADLGLTAREVEVLHLVAKGWSDKEIGSALAISPNTASRHVAALRSKLDAPSRTWAVTVARELGLL